MKKSPGLLNLKTLNRNNIYNFIYDQHEVSKQQIVQDLNLGLSTVSQNIKLLEDAGLIERSGSYNSTGGRKAKIIRIVRNARISIGVGILKKSIYIVAVNLYGEIIQSTVHDFQYEHTSEYYVRLSKIISDFADNNGWNKSIILGVSIATQGTISASGESINYGKIMDNYDMKLADFAKHIKYPCHLEHDSKAAAYLELWNNQEISNAVVLLLNRNFGGSLIINKKIVNGLQMHAGAIEHLCISRDGPKCYCGSRGCLETYCSANALEEAAGISIREFFENLRCEQKILQDMPNNINKENIFTSSQGNRINSDCVRIWEDYLDKLALAIRNLSIIIDGSIIISGYLAPFFTEEDILFLLKKINNFPFPMAKDQLIIGTYGQYAPAVGAALFYLNQFRKSV